MRLKDLVRPVAAEALNRRLRHSDARVGFALVYHEIVTTLRPVQKQLVPAVTETMFAEQVRYLAARYRLVRASELLEAVHDRRRREPIPVALTFDDDLRTHATRAAPVLKSAGVPGTFFLTGASVRAPTTFWWERLQCAVDRGLGLPAGLDPKNADAIVTAMPRDERERVSAELLEVLGGEPTGWALDGAGIAELASAGHEIGFHTRSHHPLIALSDDELAYELTVGEELVEAYGRPITTLAYPHGTGDERIASAAGRAGFRCAFTASGSAIAAEQHPMLLDRSYPSAGRMDRFAMHVARSLWHARVHD